MKYRLPDTISSPQDLASLIVDIQAYARWFSHESIKHQAGGKRQSEPPVISPAAELVLRDWQGKEKLSRDKLDSLIRTLVDYKSTAPTLTMTLAAPPTHPVKATLVSWCRENIAPDILVTFQFNSTLLGGMVVRVGSRVFDWSFRRRILENRDSFPEVLKRV